MLPFARRPVAENIFSMFSNAGGGSGQPAAPAPSGPNNPGNMENGANNQNNQQQQGDKNQQQQQQQGDADKSPLDEFKGLWDTPPAPKEGEAVEPDWEDHNSIVPQIKIDPAKLLASAKKLDFARAMNPDRVKAALAGDVGAFNESVNSAVQAAFAHSANSFTQITQTMMAQMAKNLYSGTLPHQFRKHQINAAIDSADPIFQDPAVAPMLEMAKNQLRTKYPKASPAEITKYAQNYIRGFAETVTKGKKDGNQPGDRKSSGQQQNGEMDWMEFASSTPKP